MRKIFFNILMITLTGVCLGQENQILPPTWAEYEEQLPDQFQRFIISWEIISPSLSYIREVQPTHHELMEIDLSVDLRKQAYENKTPLLITEKKKTYDISKLRIFRPTNEYRSGVIITGRRRLDYSVYRGEVKNTVYKDASFYTGAYNPFTGLPY